MISLDLQGIQLKLRQENGKTLVFDLVRKKWLVLTPEEHVRQYILYYLTEKLSYPLAMLSVEKQLRINNLSKRFDIVVYNREHQPWMLIECKAPEVSITDTALQQLLQYHNHLQCSYWVLTNGHQTFCADACNTASIQWLQQLPPYDL